MRVVVHPTEKPGELIEDLENRFEEVREKEKIEVETDEPEKLSRVPGVKKYVVDGEERKGLGGEPIHKKAYAELNTKRDIAEAFLATVSGYSLVVTQCRREWDLKLLKRYNPSIKQVSQPSEIFEIEYALNIEGFQGLDIDITDEEVEMVYREVVS